jgi:hypothetical protein
VVEVMLKNSVIEMSVLLYVSQKLIDARHSLISLIYVLLKCLERLFEGPYTRMAFSVKLMLKKHFLTYRHMSQRLAFAQKYCGWTIKEWERVVWTNESTFEVGKNSRQIHVWRNAYERYSSSCMVPTFKSGRTSFIWRSLP